MYLIVISMFLVSKCPSEGQSMTGYVNRMWVQLGCNMWGKDILIIPHRIYSWLHCVLILLWVCHQFIMKLCELYTHPLQRDVAGTEAVVESPQCHGKTLNLWGKWISTKPQQNTTVVRHCSCYVGCTIWNQIAHYMDISQTEWTDFIHPTKQSLTE